MFGLGRKWPRRTAQFAAAGMLAASGSMFFASTALAAAPPPGGGNNGSVFINGADIKNGNDPHLTCPITIKWAGFDPAGNTYTVTFTGINPTGGTVSVVGGSNPDSGAFNPAGSDFSKVYQLQIANGTANNKNEYHVNIDVMTKTTNGQSDTKSKTVWLGSCTIVNPVQTVTLSGACNSNSGNYEWSLTANPAAAVSGTYTPPGGGSTNYTTNGAGVFSFNTGHNPGPVSFTVGTAGYSAANSPQTAGTVAACNAPIINPPPPGNPTPASATANATCSALTAHLDGGTNGATFTVTEPGGTHQVVVGGGASQDVSYASGNGKVITVSIGNTVLATKSAPTNCTGAAAPAVTEANHCSSGMNLTLSDMNGSAGVTFTVTDPDGNTQLVTVGPGQLKKVSFPVTEDTTGTVSVSAPGLAKQTFTYAKNCASVLGIKHTRKPQHKPVNKPVVKAVHEQLPFTGFNTPRALLDGAALFFVGAVLCILGARRKEDEELVY